MNSSIRHFFFHEENNYKKKNVCELELEKIVVESPFYRLTKRLLSESILLR